MPKRKTLAAVRHMMAGNAADKEGLQRAKSFLQEARRRWTRPSRLWWVRHGEVIQAVVMILVSKGKVGFLYHSPAGAPGVDEKALTELVQTVWRDAVAQGASMAQSFLLPDQTRDGLVLRRAGLTEMAELIFMRHEAGRLRAAAPFDRWTFRSYSECTETDIKETILRTYEQTLDCPPLSDVRQMDDVLASHKSTGVFWPRWWWLAEAEHQPAGCILVNQKSGGLEAQIVYMGVVPAFRGMGLGWALLSWSAENVYRDGFGTINLAVDVRNTYARRLYERFGFEEAHRKRLFVAWNDRRGAVCE